MKKINLEEKFSLFNDHWNPRIVGELNNQQVKLAKLKGEFIWHKHENEDELFLVIDGVIVSHRIGEVNMEVWNEKFAQYF